MQVEITTTTGKTAIITRAGMGLQMALDGRSGYYPKLVAASDCPAPVAAACRKLGMPFALLASGTAVPVSAADADRIRSLPAPKLSEAREKLLAIGDMQEEAERLIQDGRQAEGIALRAKAARAMDEWEAAHPEEARKRHADLKIYADDEKLREQAARNIDWWR